MLAPSQALAARSPTSATILGIPSFPVTYERVNGTSCQHDGAQHQIGQQHDDFKTWMRARAPRFEEAAGRFWPVGCRHSAAALEPIGTQCAQHRIPDLVGR